MSSYFDIIDDVINLLKEHSLEKAKEETAHALRVYHETEYKARSDEITEINKSISTIQRQIGTIKAITESYPEEERVFVRMNIQDTVICLYGEELCKLRAKKRKLSRPR